jgi:putative aldouronate transport system substrate-binding protein
MKKNSSRRKVAALMVTLAMMISLLAGCSGKETTSDTNSGNSPSQTPAAQNEKQNEDSSTESTEITYPLQTDETLTIALGYESQISASYENFGDTPYAKALQEKTGVKLEFQVFADSNALNLMFASGELPDIIFWGATGYQGGAQKAIDDGIIYPLNDLINANTPDLVKILNSDKDYLKGSMTANGDYIGFPFIKGDMMLRSTSGIIIRDDWVKELGIEIPKTAEEFYQMLKLFKEKKGATVPFSTTSFWVDQLLDSGLITSAFGLPKATSYQKDGKVQFGFAQPEFKAALEYLNKLYTEGLLDPNYSTLDNDTMNANMMNGQSGVTVGALNGGIGNYIRTMKDKGEFSVAGISSLAANHGDKPMAGYYEFPITGLFATISPSCKNKELAAQFLNYAYTEEGNLLNNFGIDGQSYTLVDNNPVFTDKITNNQEGLTMQLALAPYARSWSSGWFVQDVDYLKQYAALPQQQAALQAWSNHDGSKYVIPPVSINTDDASEYATIMSDINTYVDEMITKYIMGVEPLSTFDSDYIPALNNMNINRAVDILQAALDEFNSRQ